MNNVVITAPAGTITGSTSGGVNYFHSVSYSHIPGPFAKPLPLAPQDIDARTPHPDATALTIAAPSNASNAPVLVYIHGGRFEEGSHEDPLVEGTINARGGIVQVNLGYRVGLPGFAQFEDDEDFSYRGIEDCQLGLEWIQKNIEAFGGDPTNVTVVGQSAGATAALWLCRRDHFRGAFRRVIALSPCFPRQGFAERKSALRQALKTPITHKALESLTAAQLESGYAKFRKKFRYDMALGPSPLAPSEMADIPIVLGTMREEFHDLGTKYPWKQVAWWLAPKLGMNRSAFSAWEGMIRSSNETGQLAGDALIRRWAEQVARQAPGPTWMIEFVRNQPAQHCQELRPLFTQSPLNAWLQSYCASGQPGFAQYRPEDTVLEYNLDTSESRVTHGTLNHVAAAFSQS